MKQIENAAVRAVSVWFGVAAGGDFTFHDCVTQQLNIAKR